MAGYLICVAYESGLPIFARRIGDVPAIPFPLAASLNGVSLFGRVNKVEVMSTLTESGRVLWKDYHERISFIFVGTNDSLSDIHHLNLLNNVYQAIVFHVGLEDVINLANLDKFKKDCRRIYPIIDKYLYGLNPLDSTLYFGDITLSADVCLASETQERFQSVLESLLVNLGCGYGSIIVNGIIMAASKDMWLLKGSEICLVTFVASQPSTDRFTDIPIYLPLSSPKLPYRLIVSRTKKSNIQLVILCGQEPSATTIQSEIKRWKHQTKELFRAYIKDENPPTLNARLAVVDPSILGFMVVNVEKQRCSFSIFKDGKIDVLRTFYRTIVGSIFPFNSTTSNVDPESPQQDVFHKASESYWASEYHKCHAVQSGVYQLYVLYNARVSITAMRYTSQRLLQELMKDRMLKQ